MAIAAACAAVILLGVVTAAVLLRAPSVDPASLLR